MRQIRDYSDARHRLYCAICGTSTATSDHVPPKVFLDQPYPANLNEVGACDGCNQGLSLDEEYSACLLDEIAARSSIYLRRQKIADILASKPALARRVLDRDRSLSFANSALIDDDRLLRVAIKIAQGHAAYELGERQLALTRRSLR